jgi:hypothetical protein
MNGRSSMGRVLARMGYGVGSDVDISGYWTERYGARGVGLVKEFRLKMNV